MINPTQLFRQTTPTPPWRTAPDHPSQSALALPRQTSGAPPCMKFQCTLDIQLQHLASSLEIQNWRTILLISSGLPDTIRKSSYEITFTNDKKALKLYLLMSTGQHVPRANLEFCFVLLGKWPSANLSNLNLFVFSFRLVSINFGKQQTLGYPRLNWFVLQGKSVKSKKPFFGQHQNFKILKP